jgi:hypothetical protein
MGRNLGKRKKRGPVPIKEIVVEIEDGGSVESGAAKVSKNQRPKPPPPKTKPPSFKFRSNQPSHDAIVSSVDYWFSKADMKTNTLADIYKSVEDHFQIEALSKANRKLVRSRLKDLAAEKSIKEKEETEGSKEKRGWKGVDYDSQNVGKQDDASSVASEEIVFYPTSSSDIFSESGLFYDYDHPPDTLLAGAGDGAVVNEKKEIEVEYQQNDPTSKLSSGTVVKLVKNAAAVEKNEELDHQRRVFKGSFAHHGSGMELSSSILRFKDINFMQGKEHERHVLRGVSGTVKSGRKYTYPGNG